MLRFLALVVLLTPSACEKVKDCTATAQYEDGSVIERECIVEGQDSKTRKTSTANKKGVSSEMSWLKDTRWLWNQWREVIFRADGSFLAPAENCERPGNPKCKWSADDDNIYVWYALFLAGMLEPAPQDRLTSY